jgi:hypothetical protein
VIYFEDMEDSSDLTDVSARIEFSKAKERFPSPNFARKSSKAEEISSGII